jgi:uncharacterized membrane protein
MSTQEWIGVISTLATFGIVLIFAVVAVWHLYRGR